MDCYRALREAEFGTRNKRAGYQRQRWPAEHATDPQLWGEAIVSSVILVCFAAGALLGGVCTLRLPAYPLLLAVVFAAAGTLLTMRERERRLN